MKEVSPSVFGPGTWITMHVFALMSDEEQDRKCFVKFLEKVIENLPCKKCRKHASEYYRNNPISSSSSLFEWSWKFHNNVNQRLGKPIVVYEDAKKMYENAELLVDDGGGCSSCDDSDSSGHQEINIVVTK